MKARPPLVGLAIVSCLTACGAEAPGPAALDTRNERCRFCHMAVSDVHTAGQIMAPGEEPLFFDDIGCLASYLAGLKRLPERARVFVADHRTKVWTSAGTAVYTRVSGLDTPMGSHLVAHADAASRQADPEVLKGTIVSREEVFGPHGLEVGPATGVGGEGR